MESMILPVLMSNWLGKRTWLGAVLKNTIVKNCLKKGPIFACKICLKEGQIFANSGQILSQIVEESFRVASYVKNCLKKGQIF